MARDRTRKISCKPTSRRSSHLRTNRDWPGRLRTLNRDRPHSDEQRPRWHRFSAPTTDCSAVPAGRGRTPRPGALRAPELAGMLDERPQLRTEPPTVRGDQVALVLRRAEVEPL